MRTRWIAAGAIGLFLLAGCGSTGKTVATAPSSAAPPPAAVVSAPDAEHRAAYLQALDRIDPDIVHGRPDTAVSRGRDLCQKTTQEWVDGRAQIVKQAEERFSSPDHPDGFGPAKAARIVDAARQGLCPTP